ncbi:hypothetical protein EVG20_g5778 [Dentipellis fragilis]|uniref:Uncharacterized protein n=1 Tax=Dentipellis fragilis TaxID=205917 RepID=A0A4Y9YTB9_9AGAM|nr:hypothetical protein EVG20_g5778 [Dentipellis fragilis]
MSESITSGFGGPARQPSPSAGPSGPAQTQDTLTFEGCREQKQDIRLLFMWLRTLPRWTPEILTAPSLPALFGNMTFSSDNARDKGLVALRGQDVDAPQKYRSIIMRYMDKLQHWGCHAFYHDLGFTTSQNIWMFFMKLSTSGTSTSAVVPSGRPSKGMNPKQSSMAYLLVLNYHIADKMGWVFSLETHGNLRCEQHLVNSQRYKHACSGNLGKIVTTLKDWVSLLDTVHDAFLKATEDSSDDARTILQQKWESADWDDAAAEAVLGGLLKKGRVRKGLAHRAMVVQNFEDAAVALHLFMSGDVFLPSEVLVAKFPRLGDASGGLQLSKPISGMVFSLCLSPVALFSHKSLCSNQITEEKYYEVLTALGNTGQPEALERVEQTIWLTLMLIARGADAEACIAELLGWWGGFRETGVVIGLDSGVRTWFEEPELPSTSRVQEAREGEDPAPTDAQRDGTQMADPADVDVKFEEVYTLVQDACRVLHIDPDNVEHRAAIAKMHDAFKQARMTQCSLPKASIMLLDH